MKKALMTLAALALSAPAAHALATFEQHAVTTNARERMVIRIPTGADPRRRCACACRSPMASMPCSPWSRPVGI